MKPSFTVSAGELDAGGKAYEKPIPHAWLVNAFTESEAVPVGDGAVDVRLSKSGLDVVVHGKVKATVEVPCARCLDPVKIDLAPEISVLFEAEKRSRSASRKSGGLGGDAPHHETRRKKDAAEELELSAGEADVLPFDGENVILDDVMRDDLVLEVPMIPLCSEACPGIASAEHALPTGPKVDPRLAPLLALKKDKKE